MRRFTILSAAWALITLQVFGCSDTAPTGPVQSAGELTTSPIGKITTNELKSSTGIPISLLVEGYSADINSRGQVAGSSYGDAVLWTRGVPRVFDAWDATAVNDPGSLTLQVRDGGWYLWSQGDRVALRNPEGFYYCVVRDLNNRGESVGRCHESSGDWAAVRWTRSGMPVVLDVPATAIFPTAGGINDRGDVVGSAYEPGFGSYGVMWRNGAASILVSAPGQGLSSARAINNGGLIAGQCLSEPQFACTWHRGSVSVLEPLPGDVESWAADVSVTGAVVGSSAGPSGYSAVMWKEGTPIHLGSPPGAGNTTWARAVNERGDVAGTSILSPGALPHVVVWRTTGRTLN